MQIKKHVELPGFIIGSILKKPAIKWIGGKIDKFNIEVSGISNSQGLRETYVIASNHVKPQDRGLLKTGISSDSFIINKVVSEYTGKQTALAVNYIVDTAQVFRIPLEIFIKGTIKGFGFIPVGEGHNSFHNIFLKSVEKAISDKRPILIYPVGCQLDDFDESQELKAGAAYIALKYNLNILPTFIKGSFYWGAAGQKIYLAFGKPFSPNGLDIDQINEKIKKEILKLKSKVNESSL